MNWDAIGAIAELLGGLGVILTLVFLGFQVRHNSQAVQSETLAALTHTMNGNVLAFAQSSELSQILKDGLNNPHSLSEVDQFRFRLGMSTTMRHYETAFFARKNGLLHKQSWNGIEAMLLQMLQTRGAKFYWASQGHVFSQAFRDYVERHTAMAV